MAMKDYYQILGVTRTCTTEEIRKNYRKMAMQHHPDRNPDNPTAEEKFKEVAEAYGVLTDPVKRRQYDSCLASGGTFTDGRPGGDFAYSQEDILRDLFKDPHFQQMFSGLLREFQRSGFRYSSAFIKRSFFGGKGGIFIGGIFFLGSLAGPLLAGAARKGLSGKASLLKSVGSALGSLLGSGYKAITQGRIESSEASIRHPELDTTYSTPLTGSELQHGKTIQVLVYGENGEQTLQVKIPAGSRSGQKLRLPGKGRISPSGRGDLYLQLVQKDR
ncbi:MAG: DnaJ domain-containing protein [Proteobacteria bacterium]|nr:DnaJ domain-containing protein [Pseudomonadota bacterium]